MVRKVKLTPEHFTNEIDSVANSIMSSEPVNAVKNAVQNINTSVINPTAEAIMSSEPVNATKSAVENITSTAMNQASIAKDTIQNISTKVNENVNNTINQVMNKNLQEEAKNKNLQEEAKNRRLQEEAKSGRLQEEAKIKVTQKSDPESMLRTGYAYVQYPDEADMVEYGNYRCYRKDIIDAPKKKVERCGNKSLDKQRMDAYKYMTKNSKGINDYKHPTCNLPDYVNILNDEYEDDIMEIYRNNQHFLRSYLEDPVVRGYNVNDYDSSSALDGIGKIPLGRDFENPKPNGYVFNTSPAFEK